MIFTVDEFPDTPFEPGRPVSPVNFKGRRDDCKKIIRYIPGIIKYGAPEHFFITGKRGMGKTSFINYVSRIAEDSFNMVTIQLNYHDLIEVVDFQLTYKLGIHQFNRQCII